MVIDANKALTWLKEGNNDYINAKRNHRGDISKEKRLHTHHHGQNPYAVIICCSDSRVIPENIFMAGIGDLFVIRLAGNVVGDFALGSIEYAVSHLNTKLVLVMGHTMCGAIHSAIIDHHESFITSIINEIKGAIGNCNDNTLASKLNVFNTINKIKKSEIINELLDHDVKIVGSIYHTHSGEVEIL
jgi:carbonic anhydrase